MTVKHALFASHLDHRRVMGKITIDRRQVFDTNTPTDNHYSIGFGFRIENTKQHDAATIQIGFANNLDQRRFAGIIIIISGVLFSAFRYFSFIPPNSTGNY